jgi:UDPglucose 6-dehydrogenase
VVIGANDERAAAIMRDLYRPFTRTGAPVMVMDCASAELCKYAANAMLATRISFMNEIANVCELFGADADKVRQAIGSDRRIGTAFLFPGIGYGGSCFPKDVKAIIKFSGDRKYRFRILEGVEAVNEAQKVRLLGKLDKQLGKNLRGKTIAVWGLAFKPRTDDMREAPAIPIVQGILARGGRVRAYDPEARGVAKSIFGKKIYIARHAYDALKDADALLLVTEWNEFREPDFKKIKKAMKQPLIIDGRNLYDPKQVRALGFTYLSIGRP